MHTDFKNNSDQYVEEIGCHGRRCRNLESMKKNHIDILELLNAIIELTNPRDEFKKRLYTGEEKISKLKNES